MTKQQYFIGGITVALFIIAFVFDRFVQRSNNLDNYASIVEKHLHESENKVYQIIDDTAFIRRQVIRAEGRSAANTSADFALLKDLDREEFTVSVFQNDTLIYWTNNNAIPTPEQIADTLGTPKLIHYSNGYYDFIVQEFQDSVLGKISTTALIPIKYQFALESEYLSNRFAANKNIPTQISVTDQKSRFPIQTKSGNILCYLTASQPLKDQSSQKLLLFIYLLAFLSLCIWINYSAIKLARYRPWMGVGFLLIAVFTIRGISLYFNWLGHFSHLALFSTTYDTPILSNSLGDLLLNVLLLLWIIFFFQKELSFSSFDHLSGRAKFALTTINNFSIILALVMVTGTFKALVLESGIIFDFENVFELNTSSQLSILVVVLLLMSLFLFSHRMMQTNIEIGLSKNNRLIALAIATALSVPVLLAVDLMLPYPQMLLFATIFVVLFDLFVDTKSSNLTWLIGWLVMFAAFSSILLFRYSNVKDLQIRLANAETLSILRDSLAEEGFAKLWQELQQDSSIHYKLKPFPFQISKEEFDAPIEKNFSENNYLFNNYSFDIYAYNKYKQPALEGQTLPPAIIEERYSLAESTGFPPLKFYADNNENFSYLLKSEIKNAENPDNSLELIFEFKQKEFSQSKVYSELLLVKQFKELKNLNKYEYAIYKNRFRVGKANNTYKEVFQYPTDLPPRGQYNEIYRNGRSELIYNSPTGIVVIIGRKMGGYIKPLSLFSFFFLILIIATIILGGVNTFIKAIPNLLDFSVLKNPSLRNRIQVYMISLIIISFIIIGSLTTLFFRNEFDRYHEGRLDRKTATILQDTQREIELLLAETSSDIDISAISKIHRMDINIYDLKGKLIKSSGPEIFEKGIIAPVMDPIAFQALSKYGFANQEIDEAIGDIKFRAAYVPLKTPQGNLIAYLGLPYYSEQGGKLRSEVTDFMGYIINAYAFLLLIAGAIAIGIANSITKPLYEVGSKLKQFQLGGRNEPLEWKNTNDEIGTLVEEYNRMIKKLEDSAELLAQSEREGAWREMAKQVAHEIKNPLTPMKLSIQYLQHAYQSNPNDIEPLVKRVSGTLIEQIDNLAQIASEFSNFAKMPRAENSKIMINNLVQSVHDFFKEGEKRNDINLTLPDRPLVVYADKNHLMRVLNNLIKNASQAIPSSRRGQIGISLYEEGNDAVIKVSDNGVGISEDMLDKVFVPNFTTKSSGTGLGLAISKNIIESVDGQIYFITKEGSGTEFFVKLPIIEVKEFEQV